MNRQTLTHLPTPDDTELVRDSLRLAGSGVPPLLSTLLSLLFRSSVDSCPDPDIPGPLWLPVHEDTGTEMHDLSIRTCTCTCTCVVHVHVVIVLCILDRCFYQLCYRGSIVGWAHSHSLLSYVCVIIILNMYMYMVYSYIYM